MKTPPLLITAALLFWGVLSEFMVIAVVLVIILESSRLFTQKWDFTENDFNHIADLCVLIAVSIYVYSAIDEAKTAAYQTMKLFPCILFPLLAAQYYSIKSSIYTKSLFTAMRKYVQLSKQKQTIDLSFPYFILCLVAAGAANYTGYTYYAGLTIFGFWSLSSIRGTRYSKSSWVMLLVICIASGWVGSTGLFKLQKKITQYAQSLLYGVQDPFKAKTSIGDIGEQKMGNHIVFRVTPDPKETLPLLLREASYNSYLTTSWIASGAPLRSIPSAKDFFWDFPESANKTPTFNMKVKQYTRNAMAMLKLPIGATSVTNLEAAILKKNDLGAVMAEGGESYIEYDVAYNNDDTVDAPPNHIDLDVPEEEKPALQAIIKDLKLKGLPHATIIKRIETYFDRNFSYTLNHTGQGSRETPLAHFLLDRKAGHCELFATATVLLLRECGIPARYAIGYSAQEYSYLEQQIVVRHRHGHAWTLVFIDDVWQNLDTTSSNWMDYDDDQISQLEYIWDFFSYLKLRFNEIDWSDPTLMTYLTFFMIILLAILVRRRLKGKKRTRRVRVERKKEKLKLNKLGIDSPFYALEQAIAQQGYPRGKNETLVQWSARVQEASPKLLDYADLNTAIALHYQMRFTNATLDESVKNKLIKSSETLLKMLDR